MSDVRPFVLDLDPASSFYTSGRVKPIRCRVSDMVAQFVNEAAAWATMRGGDPLPYGFYGLDLPEDDSGVLQFGATTLYSGKVRGEYFVTKGRFYIILDASEIYYGLGGYDMMLTETPEGQVDWKEIGPDEAPYASGHWAYRSINTDAEPLVVFLIYRGTPVTTAVPLRRRATGGWWWSGTEDPPSSTTSNGRYSLTLYDRPV